MKRQLAKLFPVSTLFPLFAAFAGAGPGCNRTQPSEPTPYDAGPQRMTLQQALGMPSVKSEPPDPPKDADFVKLGKRDIDWGLDTTEAATDYAERYIQSSKRYGAERTCVHAQAARFDGARTLVETRDSSESGCHGTGAVRDTFAVDVEHDHLELADPAVGARLGDWPDGSSPEGMATPSPKEGPPIDQWPSPLVKAMKGMNLVPLRVQFYGRGSYPLISIAGWHDKLTLTSSPAELTAAAKTICGASAGFPVGVIATMDRSTVLRVRCPDTAKWEHF